MADAQGSAFRGIRQLIAKQRLQALADEQLLEHFLALKDQAAFETLVRRHGAMVLRVCRRVLGDHHDAEDACQATFLVLARRAKSVAKRHLLANWLYAVAQRTAQRAKVLAVRQRRRELSVIPACPAQPPAEAATRELCAILDEELQRLPDQCRAPLLLCCLEGRTRDQAARQLGWSLRTLERRLEQGRALLAARLTRRGATMSGAFMSVELSQQAALGTLPFGFAGKTAAEAVRFVAGKSAASELGIGATVLAEAILHAMAATKVKVLAVLLLALALGIVGAGAGFVSRQAGSLSDAKTAQKATANPQTPLAKPPVQPAIAADRFGDPLPAGALARMGSIRFRHAGGVTGSVFLPDGKSVISAGWDGAMRLWDVATGKELRRFVGPEECIERLALSPDGTRLASSARLQGDREVASVRLWDVASGKERSQLGGRAKKAEGKTFDGTGEVTSLAWSVDNKTLAVGRGDGTVQLFDADTAQQMGKLAGPKSKYGTETRCVAFSPDGAKLASCRQGGVILLADMKNLDKPQLLQGKEQDYQWLAFAPDGKTIISAGGATSSVHTIAVWDAASGKRLRDFEVGGTQLYPRYEGQGELKNPHTTCWALSADGKTLAVGYPDLTIHLWDLATAKPAGKLTSFPEHGWLPRHLVFSPDGKTLAVSGDKHCALCLLDIATDKRLLAQKLSHEYDVRALSFSPDGKILATGGPDGLVLLWNALTGEPLHDLKWPESWIYTVAFSPDGRTLASGSQGSEVRVWDAASGKLLWKQQWRVPDPVELPGMTPSRLVVAFSPDGKELAIYAASAFGASWIKMCDASTGKELRHFDAPSAFNGGALNFSADGKWLVASGNDAVWRWQVPTGELITKIAVNRTDSFEFAAISADGKSAAGFGISGASGIWDLDKGKQILAIATDKDTGYVAAFSPDGRYLAAAARRNHQDSLAIDLIELASGKTVCTHRLPGGAGVASMAFSSDGRKLATGLPDTTTLIWDMEPAPLGKNAPNLEELWNALAGDDPIAAWRASGGMSTTPARTVEYLKTKLRRVESVDRQELMQRLQALETGLALPLPPGEMLRSTRAVAVLERIGSPDVIKMLKNLATGAADAWLTREAKAVLTRLKHGSDAPVP